MVTTLKTQAGVHKKGTLSLPEVIEKAKKHPQFRQAGAITLFIGVVRGEDQKGDTVQKLELEAYEEKANEVLANICDEVRRKKGIIDVQIHHFLGEFKVGEDLVYVLVAGDHRNNVFPALEEAVEKYKAEAPIFKKEHVVDEKGRERAYWATEKEN